MNCPEEEDLESPELEEIRCDECHRLFEGQSDEFVCSKCVDKMYPDRRDLCPRGGCIFCSGPRDNEGSRTIADVIREMESERNSPACAEAKRNRQVWFYSQPPVNYQEYLQTEFWKHIRGRVIRLAEADAEGCFNCSIALKKCWKVYGHGFQVHHLTYARLGNEHPDDLVALCPGCHAKEHGLPEPRRKA
jgi:5-methylcytosine-specific restriction endonuclease McrA